MEKNKMNIELLEKYCFDRCNEEELHAVLQWFENTAGTPEGKALLHKLWDEIPDADDTHAADFGSLLNKIHHEVNMRQAGKLMQLSDQNPVRFKRRERLIRIFMKAAAVLLLPVLGFGLFFSIKYFTAGNGAYFNTLSYNEVFSSVDAITKVNLPDGSVVWLNHSSSLKYPAVFRADLRQVILNGEGYFEVAHKSKVPFVVKAGDIQIKATGTTFDVMAYPDEDKVETSLICGKVEIEKQSPDGSMVTLAKMNPDDFAVYQKDDNNLTMRTVDDDRYVSWRSGKLVFNREPMGEVVKKLSRWYNVDIKISDPRLYDLTYTATFVNETFPQVMELIAMASPISYTITDRREISPGVFSKREVCLSMRVKK